MQVEILKFIQSIQSDIMDLFFLIVTISTETPIIIIITSMIYWCINKKIGQMMLFSLIGNIVVNTGIKDMFKSVRPIGTEGIRSLRVDTATGYSFPSGHTQLGTSFWTLITIIYQRKMIIFISVVMATLIGVSRLYLGVHWPIDVIFGWIFGLVFTVIFSSIFKNIDKTKEYIKYIYVIIPLVCVLIFVDTIKYIKMFGLLCGFIMGYIIEDKYIKFNTNYEIKKEISFLKQEQYIKKIKHRTKLNVIRYILGIVILIVTYIVLDRIGIETKVFGFFKYMMISFTGVCIVPFVFKLIKLD